jgi:two-component system, chemotaxis family, sensor kinase Cph1
MVSHQFEPNGSRHSARLVTSPSCHNHLCLIYNDRVEQLATVIPYIKSGLELGEECLYLVNDNTAKNVIDAIKLTLFDIDKALASGALAILTKTDSYVKYKNFDSEWMDFWVK